MIRWIFFALGLLSLRASAQDITALLNKATQAERAFREEEALGVYRQVLTLQPRNIVALCRCSDLSCRIGNRQGDRDKKISFFKAGYQYAQTAYRLDSTNSEADIVMAFSLGRMTLIQSGKEKVAAAVDIKRYAENAIRNDPSNFKAYHILGRWNYEVSRLNFLERAFARWFFGALPEASLSDAIRDYEKSMVLRPDFMLNYLELSKALHRDGQDVRAIQLLRQMDNLRDEMYDDRQVRAEGRKLLNDWGAK
jgi:tetratricopeptide (TPR) repeat protein